VKIALFIHQLNDGGAQKVLLALAKAFVRIGVDVDVVLVKKGGVNSHQIPEPVNIVMLRGGRTLLAIKSLAEYVDRVKPDYLISALAQNNIAAILAKFLSKSETKFIVTEHSIASRSYMDASDLTLKISYFLQKFLYKFSDKCIAVSKAVADDLMQFADLESERIAVVGNPAYSDDIVKMSKFPHVEYLPEKYILGVGRLHPVKQFDKLIKFYSELKDSYPDVKLVIVGDGEQRKALKDLVCRYSIDQDVYFLGFLENPYPVMAKAKLLAVTSLYEGFGNVVVEAFSCGLPVVALNNGGVSDIVTEGTESYVVEESQFLDSVIRVLDGGTPEGREFRLKRARDFDEMSVAAEYINQLEAISNE